MRVRGGVVRRFNRKPGGGDGRAAIRLILAALCAAAFAVAVAAPAGAVAVRQGLFQTYEKRSSKTEIFLKWKSVMRRSSAERRRRSDRCSSRNDTGCAIERWRRFLDGQRRQPPMAQLRSVHAFVNRTAYITDNDNYGTVDYWATPREFFTRGGDCEDYAITKYLSLKSLGWSADRMRIVVLIDRRKRQAHAVLAVYRGGKAYILDNQLAAVTTDTEIGHYRPVYSINERFWWFHIPQQPAAN